MIYQVIGITLLCLVAFALFFLLLANTIASLYGAPPLSSPRNLGWQKFADPNKTFLDLGCGSGEVLLRAAPHFKHVYGIEASPLHYYISKWRTRKQTNISVIFGNFFTNQWPEVDYIYCYLLDRPMERLRSRFATSGATILSLCFPIPKWEIDETIVEADRSLYVYKPALERAVK